MNYLDLLAAPLSTLTIAAIILLVAGITKGVVGIGMPIVAVPLLATVFPLPTTVMLLTIPLLVTNFAQAISGDPILSLLRRMWPILVGMVLGVAIGVYLLTSLRPLVLQPLVGTALIAIAALMLVAPKLTCPARFEPVASPLVGFAGGVLGGLAGQPGPLVFLYLLSREITGSRFVQYSSMYVLISAIVLTTAMGHAGSMGWASATISAACTVPILIGMWLGTSLRGRVPPRMVRILILGVVFLGGINLIGPTLHAFASTQVSSFRAPDHRADLKNASPAAVDLMSPNSALVARQD
jgi:uncharacterized membrane protein YfcA